MSRLSLLLSVALLLVITAQAVPQGGPGGNGPIGRRPPGGGPPFGHPGGPHGPLSEEKREKVKRKLIAKTCGEDSEPESCTCSDGSEVPFPGFPTPGSPPPRPCSNGRPTSCKCDNGNTFSLPPKPSEVFGILAEIAAEAKEAVCELEGDVSGNILFHQMGENVHVAGEVMGLQKGNYGFDIHEDPHLTVGCKDAGGHNNPMNKKHGSLISTERLSQRFGNITAGDDFKATIDITVADTNLDDFVNRAIVVHEAEDNLGRGENEESSKAGNAGRRLNCCKVTMNSAASIRLDVLGGLLILLVLMI